MKLTMSTSNGVFTVLVHDDGDVTSAHDHARTLIGSVASGCQVSEPFAITISDDDGSNRVHMAGKIARNLRDKGNTLLNLYDQMRTEQLIYVDNEE